MFGPDPNNKHPMAGFPQLCFIKNTINNPNIIIGDYTYYDDPQDSENFERNVLYHFPFIGDPLLPGPLLTFRLSPVKIQLREHFTGCFMVSFRHGHLQVCPVTGAAPLGE
jgi:hypothetical protein